MANPLDSFKGLPPWGKAAVAAGGAGAVYLVWRARKNAAAAAGTAAGGLTTPDAATGAGTGDGSVTAGPGTVSGTTGTTAGYGTPDQWAAAAQAGLAQIGYDPQAVAAALGAYLAGQPLTSAQAAIVNAAKAEFDTQGLALPPVVLVPSTPPAHTGNTAPAVSGGHVISVSTSEAVVGWTGHNATSYRVKITGPGPLNGRQDTVTAPKAVYSGLEAGHSYTVTVTPVGANGHAGHPGQITVKTTKGK
jgi:hypothetical protein